MCVLNNVLFVYVSVVYQIGIMSLGSWPDVREKCTDV